MPNFETIIGLEIHAQLKTKRKMFCGCNNDAQGKEPNLVVCPRCIGMPGTLPVANKEAIIMTIQTGLAFNCEIPETSKFDRKHYFYPDLPKGYQISQYDQPICQKGSVKIQNTNSEIRNIRLNRIHLEEDAGKLIHPAGRDYSLVDLNRSSTPLMEIVTEPDLRSPEEAKILMKHIQAELINQGVSDADMEKGHMRCDANISTRRGQETTPIVEIKNINSFRFLQKALEFEAIRQKDEFESLKTKKGKITRGFDSKKGETYEQRTKEEAADYRYFPEPDLPPIESTELIKEASLRVKEPAEKNLEHIITSVGVNKEEAQKILSDNNIKQIITKNINEPWLGNLAKLLIHSPELAKKDDVLLEEYAEAIHNGSISSSLAKQQIIDEVRISNSNSGNDLSQQIREFMIKLIKDNPDAVAKYKSGKSNLFGFFVGQLMKEFRGKVEPSIVNKIVEEELQK